MEQSKLKPGDVVQLSPSETENKSFSGCMLVVTEVRPWGALGYVQAPGEDGEPGEQSYYRASWNEMELVGEAEWVFHPHVE